MSKFVLYYLTLLILRDVTASCFNNTTLGDVECVYINRYNAWQWTTCVSDLYIRQKSKGKHGCSTGNNKCIYQCMLEIYGADSGQVNKRCACFPTELNFDRNKVLEKWCFTPHGVECDWYKNCLARQYSGHKTVQFRKEVVAFAEQFCGLYLNAYSQFSAVTNLWVNGVRKCLLVNLVPFLRPWQLANSSKNLTKKAMTAFSKCYLSSFPRIPSVCHIPLHDFWAIFWHLRQTLQKLNTQKLLRQILRIVEHCPQFQEEKLAQGKVKKLILRLVGNIYGSRLSSFHELQEIGNEIATRFNFDENGIAWFSYFQKNSKEGAEMVLYIADKEEHKLAQKLSNSYPVINLNKTVSNFVKCARRGGVFQANHGLQNYCLSEITICKDFPCMQNYSWNVTGKAATTAKLSSKSDTLTLSSIAYFLSVMIVFNLLFY